ncbi:MarR family winged helix-turn-helix transcriptional regulator [Stomatohabitans albus]|uniref:MarR family winged helix-turn-helix transcriptional regulator n=1 Tax=Stomatohabitans albus TaxID=3110766 RepID=UPI00300C2D39
MIGRRVERTWNRLLRKHEMTNADFTALAVLVDGPASQGQLAYGMGIDPRNAGAEVKRLQKRGWVILRRDAQDSRALRIELSDQGRAQWELIQEVLVNERKSQLAALSPEEITELERLLNKLNDGATWDQ